ncbi:MAG: hypothetical protein QM207_07920, partial [Thermobispora sp.]|nr:hypothetical protein [Thermobispora sp.]
MRKLLFVGAIAAGLLVSGCGGAEQKSTPVAANEVNQTSPGELSPTATEMSPEISPSPMSPASPAQATPTGPAKIDVAQTRFGPVLVGEGGRTVYMFTKDKNGQPTCVDACAAAWPPVLTLGQPQAGPGVKADLLGTVQRPDGTTQVTYNKHPLYYYAKDQQPGDLTGHDVDDF